MTEVLPLSPENRNSNLMTLWGWWLYFNLGGEDISVGRRNTWPNGPQQSCDAQPAEFNGF